MSSSDTIKIFNHDLTRLLFVRVGRFPPSTDIELSSFVRTAKGNFNDGNCSPVRLRAVALTDFLYAASGEWNI